MASWRPAPAAKALLDQANARAPRRSRASDGLKGDPAHAARTSFHNPDSRGVVLAVDLTHDPAHGIDAHLLAHDAVARRDPRVLEAISQGRIWTRKRAAEGWRVYGGSNRHDKHAHISIDRAHENDTSPWWPTRPAVTKAPTFDARPGPVVIDRKPPTQEDDMPAPIRLVVVDHKAGKTYDVDLDARTAKVIDAQWGEALVAAGIGSTDKPAVVEQVFRTVKRPA